VADSPAAAARGEDVLVTMVADDPALEEVMLGASGALPALAPGAIHVSMSTISPKLSRALAERHRVAGQQYCAALVFGRPEAAEAMPLASLMRDRYLSGVARGWGDIDWAGLARIAAADAGLSPSVATRPRSPE